MDKRHHLWPQGLRKRRGPEVGQREQDDVLDAGVGQRGDRLVDAPDNVGDEGLNLLGRLGQAGLQECIVVVAADIDQRGRAFRRLVAVEISEISSDLGRQIDWQRLSGHWIDDQRRRQVARFRASEGAIIETHVQEAGELLRINGAVGEAALPSRRLRKADQVEQIPIVRQTVTKDDERGRAVRKLRR